MDRAAEVWVAIAAIDIAISSVGEESCRFRSTMKSTAID
jgi:hypothetical protein